MNAPKAALPLEPKKQGPPATRPQQQQPGRCCSEACFLTGLLSMTRNAPRARMNRASAQANTRCQNRSIQSMEGRGQGRKSGGEGEKCSQQLCVSWAARQVAGPALTRRWPFCIFCPPLAGIHHR